MLHANFVFFSFYFFFSFSRQRCVVLSLFDIGPVSIYNFYSVSPRTPTKSKLVQSSISRFSSQGKKPSFSTFDQVETKCWNPRRTSWPELYVLYTLAYLFYGNALVWLFLLLLFVCNNFFFYMTFEQNYNYFNILNFKLCTRWNFRNTIDLFFRLGMLCHVM